MPKKIQSGPRRRSLHAVEQPVPVTAHLAAEHSFPIIGIGASAGGLEALEQFLRPVPPDCGCAFVIVQHLDPNHVCLLVELLQRICSLRVIEITDGLRALSNTVYVIPPSRDLSILHGQFHLISVGESPGLRLPIDVFFRSLAIDRHEHSIGVILSGMGSDGTLGIRAIKEQAGAVFVQTPESAKFDGMPRCAIDAGLADAVAPADELAGKIFAYLQLAPLLTVRAPLDLADPHHNEIDKVILLLRTRTGHDFSLYKKSTLYRRIERRMCLHQLVKIADYVRYLQENIAEADLLFKELLIGVTSFFRDPAVWDQLQSEGFPGLFAAHPEGGVLRAWTPACSTGEEAFTLAITFRESVERVKPAAHFGLQIFATDLDPDAINRARIGVYPDTIAADVSAARLRRYFIKERAGYRVGKEIRDMVIFAPQNLVMDPPFTKLDLVTCRNLLIYLEADLQRKVLPLFHYSLNPDGLLLLGSSETVGVAADSFAELSGKTRLYRRKEIDTNPDLLHFPTAFVPRHANGLNQMTAPTSFLAPPSTPNLQSLTESLILQQFSPAAVLASGAGDLVFINGKTGRYLEPATGKANLNLFAMAREGLRNMLHEAFTRAVHQQAAVVLRNITVGLSTHGGTSSGIVYVDVTVQPLAEPVGLRGMVLVVFTEVPFPTTPAKSGRREKATVQTARLAALTQEVQQTRSDMQIVRDEMQTSQEELKATNEELQCTNEELRSTNEELTVSKEEMQSMNEELLAVNHELQSKVEELGRTSDDMKNLLNSTDIATLFLDENLKVRRFTAQTTSLIQLIPGDIGRPIADLVSKLDYPALVPDAQEVLRSLIFHEVKVPADDGRWFCVRIMPYRTQSNHINGVVVTFIDISVSKALEITLRKALATLQAHDTDQTTQLDRAKTLEGVLRTAQTVLEERLADHALQLGKMENALLRGSKK